MIRFIALMLIGLTLPGWAERIIYYDFEEGVGTTIHNRGSLEVDGEFVGGDREGSWEASQIGYGRAAALNGGDVSGSRGESCGEFKVCSYLDDRPADVRFVDTGLNLSDLGLQKTDATYMAWIRWDGHLGVSSLVDLFGAADRTDHDPLVGPQLRLSLWADEGKMSFFVINSGNCGANGFECSFSDVNSYGVAEIDTAVVGEWLHLTYQFHLNQVQVFLNGMPVFDEPQLTERWDIDDNLQVGWWAWQTFNGLIDEVKVFDEALTEEEILTEMKPSMAASDPSINVPPVFECGRLPFFPESQKSLALFNAGWTQDLEVQSARFIGSGSEGFRVDSFTPSIAPGVEGLITFTVLPTMQSGERSSTLEIRSNDTNNPVFEVAVSASTFEQSGLTAHYKLDDKEGLFAVANAVSTRGVASIEGDVSLAVPGLTKADGRAAAFNGGVLRVPATALPRETFDLSVGLWMKASGEVLDLQTIFARGNRELDYALVLIDSRLAWFEGDSEVPKFVTGTLDFSSATLHIVATVSQEDGVRKARLYVNGRMLGPVVDFAPAVEGSSLTPLYFGGFGEVLPFRGVLDDLQIYERMLTSAESKTLFSLSETKQDALAPDSDGDGLSDVFEFEVHTDPLQTDTDLDELDDGREIQLGSNPLIRDSDGGGTWDGIEASGGTDPKVAEDDVPAWQIRLAAVNDGSSFSKFLNGELDSISLYEETEFQRTAIDFTRPDSRLKGEIFPGGERLDLLAVHPDYLVRIKGSIWIEESGVYTFGVAREGSYRLIVDGAIISETAESNQQGFETYALTLAAGQHEMKVEWFSSRFTMELFWWPEPGEFLEDPPFDRAVLLSPSSAIEEDVDGDGLSDALEWKYFGTLDHDETLDPDNDGLTTREEFALSSNPVLDDSDGDGLTDGVERDQGTSLIASDSDEDGLSDYDELELHGTDPSNEDGDGDGLSDGWEIEHGSDPLGLEDESEARLLLNYSFEEGVGDLVRNEGLRGDGELFGWDLKNAWGKADDVMSRGSGFLRFDPPTDEGIANPESPGAGDGTTYIDTGMSGEQLGVTGEGGYTAMAWVWLGADLFAQLRPVFHQTDRTFIAGLNSGSTLTHSHADEFSLGPRIDQMRWTHLAWRYYRGQLTMIVDGVESQTFVLRGALEDDSATVLVSAPESNQRFGAIVGWVGAMDDVRIYDAPLTSAKIRAIAELSQSVPIVASIERTTEGVEIRWLTTPGLSYEVEFASTMRDDWFTVGSHTARGAEGSFFDRRNVARGFYRVRLVD